ncbi:MAG: quinolinate synthase NadA [Candidatus Auribacterota bacterium]|jgi:quinolinate synthase|nr:quinolinate synthase NadA [Candidatus Auribacterota bacterium]
MTVENEQQIIETINDIKKQNGDKLVILGHYYQRREILTVADYMGDSFELARRAASLDDAKYIIFCGVHFMAESASILSKPYQTVQLPDLDAGCPMADMARLPEVEKAWNTITEFIPSSQIVPITYMNSIASIKAFCGRHGGAVCTSSNANILFKWARQQGKKIFFLPDEHLGRNTAHNLNIPEDKMFVWDPLMPDDKRIIANIDAVELILWKGHCHVHTFFNVEHVNYIRKNFPSAVIIAHPECTRDVIQQVDYSGSTSFIERYVKEAPSGSVIAIATEINMVDRLARQYADKQIIPVARSLCPNMFKINLPKLKTTLEQLGRYNIIEVPQSVRQDAHRALSAMLSVVQSAQ